jgi:hypothetical protein
MLKLKAIIGTTEVIPLVTIVTDPSKPLNIIQAIMFPITLIMLMTKNTGHIAKPQASPTDPSYQSLQDTPAIMSLNTSIWKPTKKAGLMNPTEAIQAGHLMIPPLATEHTENQIIHIKATGLAIGPILPNKAKAALNLILIAAAVQAVTAVATPAAPQAEASPEPAAVLALTKSVIWNKQNFILSFI